VPAAGPELSAWFEARGLDWDHARAEVQADPAFQLAAALWSAGFELEASREYGVLADTLARQPERLFALSALLARPPTQHLSLTFATRALRASRVPVLDLPLELQRLVYPLPYEPVVRANADRFGVDPLLLAALTRQESTFNPGARSVAGALGLTQVMPQTGRLIAHALGDADFESSDLLRPVVSLEYGAWYLAGRLERYEGRVPPALAAYNAGDGAVNSWLSSYCSDPDCFAERVPYQETHRFVRVVSENYANYLRLYGTR
jgi:soluble lytic murein transglycosylase